MLLPHAWSCALSLHDALPISFFERAIASGQEGLVAKGLDARYDAGARGAAWLKVKLAHTLDLAVLAAEWGHGRRRDRKSTRLNSSHLGMPYAGLCFKKKKK